MRDSEKFTGNIRYSEKKRLGRESLLIMEVEIHAKGTTHSPDPSDVHGREYDTKFWRYATMRDLPILYKEGHL